MRPTFTRTRTRTLILILMLLAGTASAGSIESLLMPGKVIAGHAKFEEECSRCHDRADRNRQTALCMACHEAVAQDVRTAKGFHGRIPGIATGQCRACHSEHQGRDADIVNLSRPAFDHARTDFALDGAHRAVDCEACHARGKRYREAPSRCIDCHRKDEPHQGRLGSDCGACHEAGAWRPARFDHGKTRFALRDRHAQLPCDACHLGNRYKDTPMQCASCHAPDDVHRGGRGSDCAACHSTAGWKVSKFDHARETGYALDGAHGGLECRACHTTANMKDPLPRECAGCHRRDDAHATRLGDACEKCHVTSDWQRTTFDHARDARFELLGRHAKLGCHACHTDVVARQKLGTACQDCHRTDDVHGGRLGADCARCHGTESWRAGLVFDHDLTEFPLVGLHVAVPCHECHASPGYQGTAQDCFTCHREDDRHQGSLGKDCEACHSPNGWGIWEFDHAKTARFALLGAHARAACADCHKQPPDIVKLSQDCASCHVQDDVHLGQFGRQCQRCHGTTTFRGARLR